MNTAVCVPVVFCGLKKTDTVTFAFSERLRPKTFLCCPTVSRSLVLKNNVRVHVRTAHLEGATNPAYRYNYK